MKRIVAAVLSVLLALSVLAGCTDVELNQKTIDEIQQFANSPEAENLFQQLADALEQASKEQSGSSAANTASSSAVIGLADANELEKKYIEYLGGQLYDAVSKSLSRGEDLPDCYSSIPTDKTAEKYPQKFDLRDYDLITPVKNQNPWGTCWAFGTLSAAETSILTSYGMTQTEYEKEYGAPLDLSEKHLAWFTANALPEKSDYPEGKYPYDVTQAGEGSHAANSINSTYDFGGNFFLATSVMASGSGPIAESRVPYTDSEGGTDPEGDWSVAEELRFKSEYTLVDSNVLPSPASVDKDGKYTYNEAATSAMKEELLSGRAVGISFLADHSMPQEMIMANQKNALLEKGLATEDEAIQYSKTFVGLREATEDELKSYISLRLKLNGKDDVTYDLSGLDKEQLLKVFTSPVIGTDLKNVLAYESKQYMVFPKDENGNTIWARYANEPVLCNHCVCVVGWDDTFPASYFPEDRRPPADGAWITKNSWGEGWGMNGYFYLSYYDQTLEGCRSFEFTPMKTDTMEVLEKDFMPAECINSTLMDAPVATSSILTTEVDGVPQYLSVLTGDFDTEYTVSIYLLEDDAVTPTDGILLDYVTSTAHLAGYHRVRLGNNIYVPKGSRLGITVIEKVNTDDGIKYALVNTSSLGEKFVEYKNNNTPNSQSRYCKGIINKGESFICFGENRWIDWKDVTDSFYAQGGNFDYIQYDNLPLKIFSYTIDDVTHMHDFSLTSNVPGGTAKICTECGYPLTILDDNH